MRCPLPRPPSPVPGPPPTPVVYPFYSLPSRSLPSPLAPRRSSRSRFVALLSFLPPSTRSSQCTGDVTSIRISCRKKRPESMGFFPILIRPPRLGTSVRPFQRSLFPQSGALPARPPARPLPLRLSFFSITGRHPEIASDETITPAGFIHTESVCIAFFRGSGEPFQRLAISSTNYSRGYAICSAESTSCVSR
jgi:hypothetical protein